MYHISPKGNNEVFKKFVYNSWGCSALSPSACWKMNVWTWLSTDIPQWCVQWPVLFFSFFKATLYYFLLCHFVVLSNFKWLVTEWNGFLLDGRGAFLQFNEFRFYSGLFWFLHEAVLFMWLFDVKTKIVAKNNDGWPICLGESLLCACTALIGWQFDSE